MDRQKQMNKTPGEVAYEAMFSGPLPSHMQTPLAWKVLKVLHPDTADGWERAANAVLQAAGNGDIEIPHLEMDGEI
jgi:hypothetical protein